MIAEWMGSIFKQKKSSYNLRKGPTENLKKLSQPAMVQMALTVEVLLYGTFCLMKLDSAIHFSNLKVNLLNY